MGFEVSDEVVELNARLEAFMRELRVSDSLHSPGGEAALLFEDARVPVSNMIKGEGGASWRGQVYAERFEQYKDAKISLPEADLMRIEVKVGIMSRTVNWKRVAAVPDD